MARCGNEWCGQCQIIKLLGQVLDPETQAAAEKAVKQVRELATF